MWKRLSAKTKIRMNTSFTPICTNLVQTHQRRKFWRLMEGVAQEVAEESISTSAGAEQV